MGILSLTEHSTSGMIRGNGDEWIGTVIKGDRGWFVLNFNGSYWHQGEPTHGTTSIDANELGRNGVKHFKTPRAAAMAFRKAYYGR